MGLYLFFTFSLPKKCFREVKGVADSGWLIAIIGPKLTEIGMIFSLQPVRSQRSGKSKKLKADFVVSRSGEQFQWCSETNQGELFIFQWEFNEADTRGVAGLN